MDILPLSKKVQSKIKRYNLQRKTTKQLKLFQSNPKHPSLNAEVLEPKELGIYSFRVDKKLRALFIFRPDKNAIEILTITLHYH